MDFFKFRTWTLNLKSLLLIVGSVIIYVLYGLFISDGDVSDGMFYFNTSGLIVELFYAILRFDLSQIQFLTNKIIGFGWFLPGTSIVISPVRFFTDDIFIAKIYIYLVNIILHIFLCYKLKKVFSFKIALAYHLLTLFIPLYNIFGMSFMGEILGGKLFLLLVLYALDVSKNQGFSKFNLKLCLGFAFLLFWMIFLRINLAYVAITYVALIVLDAAYLSKIKESKVPLKNAILNSILIGVFTMIFFVPWTYGLSNKFGGFIFPTTSKYIGKVVRLTDDDWKSKNLDNGAYASDSSFSIFGRVHIYYNLKSKKENRSYIELVKEDAAALKRKNTLSKGIKAIRQNYSIIPQRIFRFSDDWMSNSIFIINNSVYGVIKFFIRFFFWIFIFVTILFLVIPFIDRDKAKDFIKIKILFIGTLPHFVGKSFHNRHLYVEYPIQTLIAILLLLYLFDNFVNLKANTPKTKIKLDLASIIQILFSCLIICLLAFFIFYN